MLKIRIFFFTNKQTGVSLLAVFLIMTVMMRACTLRIFLRNKQSVEVQSESHSHNLLIFNFHLAVFDANDSAYIFGAIVWSYQENDKYDNFKVAPNI
jgi:hypothetical protein